MILLTDTLLICQKFGNGKEEKLVLKYPPLPLELVRTRDVETKVGMAANLIEFMMSSKEFNELVNFLTKEQFETLEGQGLKKKKDGEEIIDYVYENFIKTKSESNCSAEYQQKFKEFFLEYKLSKFAMVYLEYFEMLDKNAKVKFLNDFENAKQNLINSKDMIRREKFIENESNQISQQSENNFQLEKDAVLLSADGVIERQYGWMYTNDETKGEEIMSVITNPFLFDKNTNTYKDFTRCFLKLYQNSKTCWLQLLDVVTLRVFLKVSISGIFFFYEENVINSLEEENKTKQKKKKDDDDNKLILEGINWEGKKQTFCCTLRLKEDLMNLKKKIQEKINFQLKTLIKEYTERKKVLVQDDSSSQSLEYHKYKSSIPCCMLGGENKGNVKEVELIIFDYYIPKPEEFETKFVFPRLKIVKKIPEMEGLLVLDCTMELEMKVYLELDKVVLEILKDETVFLYKFYFGSSVEDFNKINIFLLNFQQEKKNCELIKTLITERNRLKKNFFFEEVEQEEEEDKKKNLEDEKKINKIKSIDQEEKIEKDFSIVESKKVTKEKLIKEEETFTLSDASIKNVEDKNLPDNKSMVNLGDLRDLLQYLSVNGISNKNPMEMEKYSKLFSCLENSNLPPSLSASSSNETLRQHQIFTSQPCLEEATNKKYSPLKVSKFVNDLRKIDIFEKKKTNLQKLSRVENYFNELYKK
ncbi:hypothetical protein HDU92_007133 [Lobulomyces angularis]|nr:hypothetical protein HDU92_007133 [Lobulomyces angularis]